MAERGVVRKDDGILDARKMHVQGSVSAEKYPSMRNRENDAPPFPLATVANHIPK